MNLRGVRAIYLFELARTWRTLTQSIAAPVISTSLYFVVFGSAIGGRMADQEAIQGNAPAMLRLHINRVRMQGVARRSHAPELVEQVADDLLLVHKLFECIMVRPPQRQRLPVAQRLT